MKKGAIMQPRIPKYGEEYTKAWERVVVEETVVYLEVTINSRSIEHDENDKRLGRAISYARRMKVCGIHEGTTNRAMVLEACRTLVLSKTTYLLHLCQQKNRDSQEMDRARKYHHEHGAGTVLGPTTTAPTRIMQMANEGTTDTTELQDWIEDLQGEKRNSKTIC